MTPEHRFNRWCTAMAKRPHRQARALTWPTLTVFPFIACPDEHLLLKPNELVQGSAEYPG